MAKRTETPHQTVAELVTGHFRERAGYAVWRSAGTADWLLICTLAGRGRFGHATGEIQAVPGDLVLIRPAALHDYGVEPRLQRWELLWAHFQPRPAWLELLAWPEAAPGLLHLNLQHSRLWTRVARRVADVHALATSAHRRRGSLAMNALEEVFLWCDAANPRAVATPVDDRIRAAMDFACARLADRLAVADIADAAGLSVSRLAHLFRAQVGCTPQQFLERQRLQRAAQLLTLSGHPVKRIAREVGFDNPFYFTLRFKRFTGCSPRQYRSRPLPAGKSSRFANQTTT